MFKYKHAKNINEHGKHENNELFVPNFSQILNLRRSNEHVAFQNLSIYYTWKKIRQQYKDNKIKIIAPTWNDELELLHDSYSVSDTEDYIG